MRWSESDLELWRRKQRAPQRREGRGIAPTEKDLLAYVLKVAKLHGFLAYHTFDSRRSTPGFPDVTLVKPGRLIFVELKSPTGKLTQEQATWLDMLRHSVSGVEVYEWRPVDWPKIESVLSQHEGENKNEDSCSANGPTAQAVSASKSKERGEREG